MEFFISSNEKYYLLKVKGEMIGADCAQVSNQFINTVKALGKPVIMDLSEVEYIDSRGLGIIVFLYTHVKKKGERFLLSGVSREIMKILKVTALDTILGIYPDIESIVNNEL